MTEVDKLSDRVSRLEHIVLELQQQLHHARYAAEPETTGDKIAIQAARELVDRLANQDAQILVVAKGDERLFDIFGRTAGNFPQNSEGEYSGFPLASDESAIAHLESLACDGWTHLLVPESSRWWVTSFGGFFEHLATSFVLLEDVAGAGVLFSLSAEQASRGRSLRRELARLERRLGYSMSVLDWSAVDVADRLGQALAVFCPPYPELALLPYLDNSVDVVIVDDPTRLSEASRVASAIVAELDAGNGSLVSITECGELSLDESATLYNSHSRQVLCTGTWSKDALALLTRNLDSGSEVAEMTVGEGVDLARTLADEDVVLFLEDNCVLFPGALDAIECALADHAVGAVVPKVFAPDGSLLQAGELVFADGTVGEVAMNSFASHAPWHEFSRHSAGGSRALAAKAGALKKLSEHSDGPKLHELGGLLWSAGFEVLYIPTAATVVVGTEHGDGTRLDALRMAGPPWAEKLEGCSNRPQVLDDAAWGRLLAETSLPDLWT